MQVCLPVKWLDLGYNLVKTHDGASAFLVVDHDEEDMIAKRAPMGNIYAPGVTPASLLVLSRRGLACYLLPYPDMVLPCRIQQHLV